MKKILIVASFLFIIFSTVVLAETNKGVVCEGGVCYDETGRVVGFNGSDVAVITKGISGFYAEIVENFYFDDVRNNPVKSTSYNPKYTDFEVDVTNGSGKRKHKFDDLGEFFLKDLRDYDRTNEELYKLGNLPIDERKYYNIDLIVEIKLNVRFNERAPEFGYPSSGYRTFTFTKFNVVKAMNEPFWQMVFRKTKRDEIIDKAQIGGRLVNGNGDDDDDDDDDDDNGGGGDLIGARLSSTINPNNILMYESDRNNTYAANISMNASGSFIKDTEGSFGNIDKYTFYVDDVYVGESSSPTYTHGVNVVPGVKTFDTFQTKVVVHDNETGKSATAVDSVTITYDTQIIIEASGRVIIDPMSSAEVPYNREGWINGYKTENRGSRTEILIRVPSDSPIISGPNGNPNSFTARGSRSYNYDYQASYVSGYDVDGNPIYGTYTATGTGSFMQGIYQRWRVTGFNVSGTNGLGSRFVPVEADGRSGYYVTSQDVRNAQISVETVWAMTDNYYTGSSSFPSGSYNRQSTPNQYEPSNLLYARTSNRYYLDHTDPDARVADDYNPNAIGLGWSSDPVNVTPIVSDNFSGIYPTSNYSINDTSHYGRDIADTFVSVPTYTTDDYDADHTLIDGMYNVTVFADDIPGNTDTSNDRYNIDTEAPRITNIVVHDELTEKQVIVDHANIVDATVSDNLSGIYYAKYWWTNGTTNGPLTDINNAITPEGSSSARNIQIPFNVPGTTYEDLKSGNWTLNFMVRDRAGNNAYTDRSLGYGPNYNPVDDDDPEDDDGGGEYYLLNPINIRVHKLENLRIENVADPRWDYYFENTRKEIGVGEMAVLRNDKSYSVGSLGDTYGYIALGYMVDFAVDAIGYEGDGDIVEIKTRYFAETINGTIEEIDFYIPTSGQYLKYSSIPSYYNKNSLIKLNKGHRQEHEFLAQLAPAQKTIINGSQIAATYRFSTYIPYNAKMLPLNPTKNTFTNYDQGTMNAKGYKKILIMFDIRALRSGVPNEVQLNYVHDEDGWNEETDPEIVNKWVNLDLMQNQKVYHGQIFWYSTDITLEDIGIEGVIVK